MGCVYTGINTTNDTFGRFKIGMTQDNVPEKRLNANDLYGLYFFYAPVVSKAGLLLLESVARFSAEKMLFPQFGTDWFTYWPKNAQEKFTHAVKVAEIIINDVEQAAKFYRINGTIHHYNFVDKYKNL